MTKPLPTKTNSTRINLVDRLMLTKHLAIMLKSGITMGEAFEALADQAKGGETRKLLNELQLQIRNGVALEKALAVYPNAFDPLYRNIVGIGEKSGNLVENLEYLAENMAKGYEFRKKVSAAMMYPGIILGAAGVSGLVLTTFVLPKMVEMFKSLDVELPLSTRILVWVADTSQKYGVFIMAGMVLIFLAMSVILRLPKIKPVWHEFLLRLPLVGELLTEIQVALICRNIGIMLGSGLPINDALRIAAQACENLVFKKYLESLNKTVEEGKGLGLEMRGKKYSHIPMIVSRMVQVGERSGKLDDSFIYLAEFFEEEVDDKVKNLGTIIEPVMLVLIAVLVGFIAFAIISPIYSLTSGIHK